MFDVVLTGFSMVWFAAALLEYILRHHIYSQVTLLAGSLLLTGAAFLTRDARHRAMVSQGARAGRMISAVTMIQSVSLITATAILMLVRLPEYIPAALAMIVGLHLLPMAHGRYRFDRIVSGLLLAWCLGCIAFVGHIHVSMAAELGTGCIMLAGVLLRQLRSSTGDAAPGMLRES